MEKLDKVELVREKCNVSYEEAREALEACDYDVLDAVIMLEQAHETTKRIAEPVASESEADEVIYELPEETGAGQAHEATGHASSRFAGAWKRFCARCAELTRYGMETTFVAERNDERMFELPLLLVVIGLLMWGASLWLLVIGLFLGFRYHIEATGKVVDGVNEAMGKAADAADSIKESIA